MSQVVASGRLLILSVALTGLLACACAEEPAPLAGQTVPAASASPAGAAAPSIPAPPTVQIEPLNGAGEGPTGAGAYRYRVQVPQLEGPAVHGQAIDAVIRALLQRQVDEFVAAAQDGSGPSDLTCTSRTIRLTARLAVLRVDCLWIEAGAARPSTSTQTFNCDLAESRILALQDLFSAGSTYLDVLSSAARAQFPPQAAPPADRTILDGTAPVVDNFKAFLLDRASLVIVFPGYQAAPGVSSPPEVSVPYDDLKRYLAPGVAALLAG